MPADILIVPNRGSSTLNPVIQFSGSAANTIRLEALQSGSVAFLGNSGSLFSIVDSMSGSLMAVSDISGLPILEVFSDDRVVAGKYNSNALVVTGSRVGIGKANPNTGVALDVTGSASITGSLSVSSTFGSNALWTDISSVAYWGGNPTKYGILTWDTGYATVAANTGNKLYLSANGSTSTPHITITTGGDVAINKTTANAKFDVNGSATITGSLNVSTGQGRYDYNYNGLQQVTISNTSTGTSAIGSLALTGGSANSYIFQLGSGYTNSGRYVAGNLLIENQHVGGLTLSATSGNVSINIGAATAPGQYSFTSTGVALNKGATPNATLDVNGNTIITGSLTSTLNIVGLASLGIGTANPTHKLKIGSGATSPVFAGDGILVDMGSSGQITFINSAVSPAIQMGLVVGTSAAMGTWSNHPLYIRAYNTDAITVTTSARVGVGKTTDINAVLDVSGNTIITGSLTVTGTITGTVQSSAPDFSPIFMIMGA